MDMFFEDSRTDKSQLVVSKRSIFQYNLKFSPQLRIESLPSSKLPDISMTGRPEDDPQSQKKYSVESAFSNLSAQLSRTCTAT
jgi:hypothetical protein